jgi:nitroreductase
MEFFATLTARHSIRAYAGTPVEVEKLERILEAVNQAPSAGNLQAFEIYLVTKLTCLSRNVPWRCCPSAMQRKSHVSAPGGS